jgi:hypothetical protein
MPATFLCPSCPCTTCVALRLQPACVGPGEKPVTALHAARIPDRLRDYDRLMREEVEVRVEQP